MNDKRQFGWPMQSEPPAPALPLPIYKWQVIATLADGSTQRDVVTMSASTTQPEPIAMAIWGRYRQHGGMCIPGDDKSCGFTPSAWIVRLDIVLISEERAH